MTGPSPLWTMPMACRCVVCGVEAIGMAVFFDQRQVVHVASAKRRDCVLPNPPTKKGGQ